MMDGTAGRVLTTESISKVVAFRQAFVSPDPSQMK
jgi:hypothetical protein